MPVNWTQRRVEVLECMWEEGLTPDVIAQKVGGGCTYQAAVAKKRQLDLARAAREKERENRKKSKITLATEPNGIAGPSRIKSWMCRWPLDEPRADGLSICGKTAQPGRPYCAEHLTLQYKQRERGPAEPKKKKK